MRFKTFKEKEYKTNFVPEIKLFYTILI